MRDRLTEAEILKICEGYDLKDGKFTRLHYQVAFAGMALLGMERHEKNSPDYLAHDSMFASACNKIGQITQPTPSGIGIGAKGNDIIERIKAVVRG